MNWQKDVTPSPVHLFTCSSLLALALATPMLPAAQAPAPLSLSGASRPLPKQKLVPPPEPRVKPHIAQPADIDTNGDKIDDEIKPVGLAKLTADQNEPVRVELVFRQQVTQQQLDAFTALGGTIEYIYQAVSYGFHGVIARNLVDQLPALYGEALVVVAHERPVRRLLLYATRNGRVRPVWVAGFAGSANGFSGNANTTIAIMDTGVDGTHTDLAGRQEFWHDYTTQALSNATDYNGHGSHVAGMALGTGAAIGANPTQLQFTSTLDYVAEGFKSGQYAAFPLHLTAGSYTLVSNAVWNKTTVSTSLRHLSSPDGSYSWTAFNSATSTSPATLTSTFTASESNDYTATITCQSRLSQFAIVNTLSPFPGVGDGFNVLRGVAPGCRWAGARVLDTHGSGSTTGIGAAMDDMVIQNGAPNNHNIKVVNMSFGGGADSTLRSKTNTMVNNGIVAVVAAGNGGGGAAMGDPATAALAITVEASSRINQLTDYSNGGLSSPGSDQDVKPDLTAPGGSFYRGAILSVDSNSSDGESDPTLNPWLPDQRANDYTTEQGTSMATPFVSGSAALVIDALQQSGLTWSFSSATHPLLVKMLLCATSTETNQPREASAGFDPTLGRAAAPKDIYEGYGLLNVDAAIECVMAGYSGGTLSDSTAGGNFDRRAWGRKVALIQNRRVVLNLATPASGDLDLYLYSATPNAKGNPVILASSTNAGNGVAESINYTPPATQTAYLVIKRVSGSGTWTLSTAATQFAIAGAGSQTAGTGNALTVTAQDGFGTTVTGYSGAHALIFSGANPSPSPVTNPTVTSNTGTPVQFGSATNLTFTNGVSSAGGLMTLYKAENAAIAATEGSLTTPSPLAVAVGPGGATTLAVAGFPSPITAGTAGNVGVTAKDAYGNTATAYTGTVHFTSSDAAAVLPANYTFVSGDSGVHTFAVTLKTAGTQAITATDTNTSSITGTQPGITVSPAGANTLAVSGFPSPITAGTAGNVTVTAKDAYGNTATAYTGTVHFSSSDAAAALPANYVFVSGDSGVHTFAVTLKTAGTQAITATDTITSSITGTQSGITVNPASPSTLAVAGFPSPINAGTAGNVTVTAKDAYGNTTPAYTGTVHFTSSDAAATLPANYTFVSGDSGVHTFAATLQTAGTQTITATDTVTGSITGAQSGIAVVPYVSFVLASSSGNETLANPAIAVSLSGASSQTVTVQYAVTGGTAVSGTNYTLPAGTLTFNPGDTTKNIPITIIHDGVCTVDLTVQITLSSPANAALRAPTVHTYTILDRDLAITARETWDTNGNGFIDAIRMAANAPLNDSFAGLSIAVTGYTVAGYDTGSGANDNEFFVRLAEGTAPDTGATPGVQVIAAGSLARQGSTESLPVDASPVTPTDKGKPVLMSASWFDASGAGVDANDPIYLTLSEPVTSNNALTGDFGLPVSNDAYGTGATVSNGQNGTDPKVVTITLGANPLLTPGGVYSPGTLAAGSATGIFVADGTRVVDAAGNAALAQTVGTAVDLQPGTESISIAWDDLTIAPRGWALGASTVGATFRAYGAFPPNGLAAHNSGNVREKFAVSCSGASPNGQAPYVWSLASTAAQNQFEMKADNGAAPYGNYTLDLATGPKDVVGQLYSGYNKPFDLQLALPPSVTAGAGTTQTITVTITATRD